MPVQPRLTFYDGKFVLIDGNPSRHAKLRKDPEWTCTSEGTYVTVSLRAAVALRSLAVESAENIFQRVLQSRYDLPALPRLEMLDPHQREGLEWILRRKRSYLAHAPGAGKTAQAILAACLAEGPGQALFIVPPQLLKNWEREILKVTEWIGRWPTIGIVPVSDKKENMAWKADFILCPDSMLTRDWVYTALRTMKKKLIAVDEASRFKESLSERSLAFYGGRSEKAAYPGLFRDARHVVFLDGSPMPNRPLELWAPTYALHPEAIDCMSLDDFGYRYCGARPNERGVWEYKHSSREEELRQKLQNDFMHVVPEEKLSHPERRRTMLFMNQDVRSAEHRSWEKKHLEGMDLSEIDEESSQGDLARFRAELGLRKIDWTSTYVGERLREKNESILLFAWHRDVCEGMAEKLSKWNPGVVMGGVSDRVREREFDLFQRGKKTILVMNIAAGGRGHNLQRASRIIFGEYSWTDELNKQCEKRGSRRGSEHSFVRCEYVVVPGSLDERILGSIFTKQSRVKRIIG